MGGPCQHPLCDGGLSRVYACLSPPAGRWHVCPVLEHLPPCRHLPGPPQGRSRRGATLHLDLCLGPAPPGQVRQSTTQQGHALLLGHAPRHASCPRADALLAPRIMPFPRHTPGLTLYAYLCTCIAKMLPPYPHTVPHPPACCTVWPLAPFSCLPRLFHAPALGKRVRTMFRSSGVLQMTLMVLAVSATGLLLGDGESRCCWEMVSHGAAGRW